MIAKCFRRDTPRAGIKRVWKDQPLPAPEVRESKETATCRVLGLDALLSMKLIAYRRKDPIHVLDLIVVGLIDQTWIARLPAELGQRLQELLYSPDACVTVDVGL